MKKLRTRAELEAERNKLICQILERKKEAAQESSNLDGLLRQLKFNPGELLLKDTSLSFGTLSILKHEKIVSVNDFATLMEDDLLRIPCLQRRHVEEIKDFLSDLGLHLGWMNF